MDDVSLKEFWKAFQTEKAVFYPGSGADVHDIKVFAEHGGSYFVHADYLEAPDLSSALEEEGFDVLRTEDLT